jgi:hypothetical protein
MSSTYEKRNVSRKILKASGSSILNNAVVPSITTSKKSFFAKSLTQSVMNEGRVQISVEQTRRFLRDKTGDTNEEHIKQFSIIESLFMELQIADPSGVYYLKTRPLQYKVSGAAEMAHEFEELVVIPSAALHFYFSSRKMGSLDAAHLTSRFQGMMHALTMKDGADRIFQPIFAVMRNESNHSWEVMKRFIDNFFPDMVHLISDKSKGLQFMKSKYDNANDTFSQASTTASKQPCIFALCSQHALKNSGGVTAASRQAVKTYAQAPTRESFEYYSDKLQKLISSKAFDYLEARKHEFCFVELRQRGLLTNYGCVSNNASESTNAKFGHLRNKGIADAVLAYLEKVNDDCLRRRAEAEKDVADGLHVPKHISDKVKTLALDMNNKV